MDRNHLRQRGSTGAAGVALRKESVDRNTDLVGAHRYKQRRSPQGERG